MYIRRIVILLLVMFGLIGCCTKETIIIAPEYKIYSDENKKLLQEDFERKVGNKKVYFAFNKSNLSKNAKETLTRQAKWLQDNPTVLVIIEGHCDKRGTKEYNLALGLRRANSVKNFLITQGIKTERLNVISYGKKNPEFIEHNKKAYRLNRKTVTIIID